MSNHLFVEQNALTVEEDRIPDAAVLEVDVVGCGDAVEAARIPRPEHRAPVDPAAPLVERRDVGRAEHGADLETPDGPGRTAGHAVHRDRAQYSQHDGLAVPVVERKPDARRRAHEAGARFVAESTVRPEIRARRQRERVSGRQHSAPAGELRSSSSWEIR